MIVKIRRLLLGLTVLGVGLYLPMAAMAESDTMVSPRLNIEERIEPTAEAIARDYRFSGNENEIIVLYLETGAGFPVNRTVQLSAPSGRLVLDSYYPTNIDFDEFKGWHMAYVLPETGDYQLTLSGTASFEGEAIPETLLRVRVASYYERLMIGAAEKLERAQYATAERLYGLAIAERPDLPMPYLSRILVSFEKVLANSSLQEEFASIEDESLIVAAMHRAFLTLDEAEQVRVIDDFRQIARTYEIAIAQGATGPDEVSVADFIAIADFLETGEATDAVINIFFGDDR